MEYWTSKEGGWKVGRETMEIGKVCTKKWAGKRGQGNTQNGKGVSFRATWPQQYRGPWSEDKEQRHCCARVLGFLQEGWAGKHSNGKGVSLPQQYRGLELDMQETSATVAFGREGMQGKVGRETLQNRGKIARKCAQKGARKCARKVCTKRWTGCTVWDNWMKLH